MNSCMSRHMFCKKNWKEEDLALSPSHPTSAKNHSYTFRVVQTDVQISLYIIHLVSSLYNLNSRM